MRLHLAALFLAVGAAAQAPEGFKTAENKAKGISLLIPATFEEIPIPPGEERIRMKFLERSLERGAATIAEIWIAESESPIRGQVETGTTESRAATESSPAPRPKAPPPILNLPNLVERYFRGAKTEVDGQVDLGGGKQLTRFRVSGAGPGSAGVGFTREFGDKSFFFLGFAEPKRFDDLVKKFERSAKSLTVKDVNASFANDIELMYRAKNYRNVEYRKEVRRNLAKGWKAEDTENFILIYDITDKVLIWKMKHDLEVIRTKYVELFPPAAPIEAVSTVRVCKDREEFLKFAGIPKQLPVAGFWNVNTQELVFYNQVKDPRYPNASHEDGYIVLYHEAFHQYIYYSAGEIAPHSWFNEGYGDYFSGAKIGDLGTKVDKIQVNPWRCGAIQRSIGNKEIAPLKELVRFEQSAYYAKGHIYYPQGWSFIYFLNECKPVKKNAAWTKILPVYFQTLVSKYREELTKIGSSPRPDQVAAAQAAARAAAVDAAFADVDYDALQAAWEQFTLSLKDPRGK